MTKENDGVERAKTLADAVSAQAQFANRTWFAMMTVAVFAVLPRDVGAGNTVSLPFSLGSVPISSFYAVVYPLMVILVIAFSSAYAQQITAQVTAQDILDDLAHEPSSHIKPRTWFDMWRSPTLNRIAPLAMSLRQIFPARTSNKVKIIVVRSYYIVLRTVGLSTYFVFPLLALWYIYVFKLGVITRRVFLFGALLATWALIQVVILDVRYARRAVRHV